MDETDLQNAGLTRVASPGNPSDPGWSPADYGLKKVRDIDPEPSGQVSTPATDAAIADFDKLSQPPPPSIEKPKPGLFEPGGLLYPGSGDWWKSHIAPLGEALKQQAVGMVREAATPPKNYWELAKQTNPMLQQLAPSIEGQASAAKMILDRARGAKGITDEQIARTASPEYAMARTMMEHPIGSREWWGAAVPLGLEAAQYAAILAPVLGPAAEAAEASFGRGIRPRPVTTEPPPVQVKPTVAPEIVGGEKFVTTKEGKVVPAPEEPPAAKPKPPPVPETDEQAEARAVNLMKRHRELGGDPEALFQSMAKEHGQNPTWGEFADELEDDIKDLSQAVPREGGETVAQQSIKRAQNIELARRRTQELRDQALREGRDPNTVKTVTPEDVEAQWQEYEQELRNRSVQEIEDAARSQKEIAAEKAQPKGGRYAKQPSYAQMEEGTAPFGVKTRPGGQVAGAGRGDYAVGEAQGATARGTVRTQPVPTGERPVAGKAPGATKEIIRGGPLWEKAKANVNKDLGLSNDPKERMRQLTQTDDPIVQPGELEKMYEYEHNALLRQEHGRTQYKPTEQPPPPGTKASVPVMITKQMESDLRSRGLTQEEINKLTPQQAHDILGKAPSPPVAPDDPKALRRKAFKKVSDGFYRHTDPESGLVVQHNKETGKWEAKHPQTGEVLNTNDTRRRALDANLSGSLEKTAEEPQVPPEVAAAAEATERETRMTEPEMVNVTKHIFGRVKARGQTGLMSKPQMLEGGREALDAGIDPEWASRTGMLEPDEKYAIVRAHGEDLRAAAHEADQAYRKHTTADNKAAADKAFWDYSEWDRYKGAPAKKKAWEANPGMDVEPDFDPHHFVDMRQQMVRENGKDFSPKQERQAMKDLQKIKETRHRRVNAMQAYDDALDKLAPDAPDIKKPGEVEAWLNKVMPCD